MRIGIDLGGTKIEGVVLSTAGDATVRKRIPTPRADGYAAVLGAIAGLVDELQSGLATPATVGVGIPGSLSPRDRRVRNSNTLCLNGELLHDDLEARLGMPIRLANDANCFAVAEAHLGAGRGYDLVFGVILGTGAGGGIVCRGVAREGAQGVAGEWGHHTLHPEGPPCYCGRRGCVETYLCGPALERRWAELVGEPRALAEIVRQPLETGAGRQWKEELLRHLGIALGNVINIVDPDVVVVGGGVSNIPFLYTEGAEAVRANIFGDVQETPIVANEMGDSAGVFGAALLWS